MHNNWMETKVYTLLKKKKVVAGSTRSKVHHELPIRALKCQRGLQNRISVPAVIHTDVLRLNEQKQYLKAPKRTEIGLLKTTGHSNLEHKI